MTEATYAAHCSKHKVLYIGYIGEQLLEHFSNHATASKTGQTTVNLQNIFTKVTI